MPHAAQQQTSFLGGEWSPYAQGRAEHPKYRTAMNVCRNGLPLEEGAWTRRSGTQFLGYTRDGNDARLLNFDFLEPNPYRIELSGTGPGFMRLWTPLGLVYTNDVQDVISLSQDNPAILTVPAGCPWATDDRIQFLYNGTVPSNSAVLRNRQFKIVEAGALDGTQWSLKDAVTDVTVDGSTINWSPTPGTITAARILDIAAPWTSADWSQDTVRSVQTGLTPDGVLNGLTFLLRGDVSPRTLLATADPSAPNFASFNLSKADFLDGPYLDPVPGLQVQPSGVDVPFPSYNSGHTYAQGDAIIYNANYYVSLVNSNTGNQPDISPSDWVTTTNAGDWDAGTTYAAGALVTYDYTITLPNGLTIPAEQTFISKLGSNTNQNPQTEASYWALQSSNLTIGSIIVRLEWQTWDATQTYNTGDIVSSSLVNYQSLVDGNLDNTPASSPSEWVVITGVPGVNSGQGFISSDVGRCIRLFSEPAGWVSGTTYDAGDVVQYPFGQGQYWTAQQTTVGNVPGADVVNWLPSATNVAQWAWGRITKVLDATDAQVSLIGFSTNSLNPGASNYLLYTGLVYTWRLGAFSESTGWPTCGCYNGGRLYLSGAIGNRFDASVGNGITNAGGIQVNFAPTAYDGTVGDNNAITYNFNSKDIQNINWMQSVANGVIAGTLAGEWLIQASVLNNPITPTNVEATQTSRYGSSAVEPINAPIATLFVQKQGLKLLEYLPDVFTGKYRAPNMSVFAKHLTAPGIAEVRYQEEQAPLVWARMNDGTLAGCTYRRISAFVNGEAQEVSEAAITGWHRHDLGSGRNMQSIMVGPNYTGLLSTLAMVTNQKNTLAPDYNVRHVEVMQDLFSAGQTNVDAWYVDDGVTPVIAEGTLNGIAGVFCYGLWHLNGYTVTAWLGGLDCGDFLVSGGQIFVPFGSAGPAPAKAGLFTQAYFEGLGTGTYGNVGTFLANVVNTPPGQNKSPSTMQWFVDGNSSHGTLENSWCAVDWDNNVAYFVTSTGGMTKFDVTDGAVILHVEPGTMFSNGHFLTLGFGDGCFGSDGFLYFTTNVNSICKIDPSTLVSVSESAAVYNTQGHCALAPINGPDGKLYLVLGLDGFTGNGSVHIFDPSTWTEIGGGFSQSGIGNSVFVGSSDSMAYFAYNNVVPTLTLFSANIGPGGTAVYTARGTLLATAIDPSWTTGIEAASVPIVDATDNNILLLVANATGSAAYIVKLNATNGAVMWKTALPSGNSAMVQGSWNHSRISGGTCVFQIGANVCLVNTVNGALTTTALGSGNGQIGGGQLSDSVTGQNMCFQDFSSATSTLHTVGINRTPPSFNFNWAQLKAGTYFQGASTAQTVYTVPAIVGHTMTSQGQTLRPVVPQDAGSRTGPAQAMTKRSHMYGALAANSMGASFGTDFSQHFYPAPYKSPGGIPYSPLTLWTGVLWDTLEATYSFDDMLAWQITRPYPTTIASVSSFRATQDR